MKSKLTYLAFIACFLLFLSNSNNPPNGRTGAPGDNGQCSNCHNGGAPLIDGNISITGIPSEVEAGNTYNVTVTVNNTTNNALKAGFQMVVLDSDNNNVGTLSNTDAFSTLSSSSGRTYHEHSPAQNFVGGTVSYSVDWTAPPVGNTANNEQITFYAAANIANGNSSTSGDYAPVTTNTTNYIAPAQVELQLLNSSDPSCNDFSDGTAEVMAFNGTPPYSYLWSNGETDAIATMLPSGTSSVTVTDALLTDASLDVILNNPALVEIELIDIIDVSCFGDASGSIIVDAFGGTGNLSYSWSNGNTSENLINVIAGDYSLIVTDQNNCTAAADFTIGGPSEELSVEIFEEFEIPCYGLFGGLNVFPFDNSNIYQWSNGNNGPSNTGIPSGEYSVTVTNQLGCQVSDTFFLDQPDSIELMFEIEYPQNGSDGSISPLVSGGIPNYDFNWSTGSTDSVLTSVGDGMFTLTVTDNNGCSKIGTAIIDALCDLNIDSVSIGQPTCYDSNDGYIEIFLTENISPIEVNWSNGEDSTYINNLEPGIYTAIVTDTFDCVDSVNVMISEPLPIELDLIFTNPSIPEPQSGAILCSPSGGTFPYSFLWSTGDTTSSIQNLEEGIYVVTVTDSNDCAVIDSVELVTVDCEIDYSLEIEDLMCYDGFTSAKIIPVDINTNYTIFWSNGDEGETADSLIAGEYYVTISDEKGCPVIDTFEVISSIDSISIDTVSIINYTCEDSPGSIYVEATGGNGNYTYQWLAGPASNEYNDLDPGNYSVAVVDDKGCSNIFTFVIDENPGIISVDLDTIPVYIDESGTFEGVPSLSNYISVTAGCNDSVYFYFDSLYIDCDGLGFIEYNGTLFNYQDSIDEISTIVLALDTIKPTVNCDEIDILSTISTYCGAGVLQLDLEFDDILVNDNCGGYFVGNPFDFTITIDSFFGSTSIIETFEFEVPFSDDSGNADVCIITEELEIQPIIEVEFEVKDASCFGESDGCISYNINSGAVPLEVFPAELCDIPAGTYNIIVSDQAGCEVEYEIVVNQPDPLVITVDSIKNEEAGESNGWIQISVSGGNPPYSYVWTENNVVVSSDEDLENFPSSQYRLTVTDSVGCTMILNSFIDIADNVYSEAFAQIEIFPNPFSNQITLMNIESNAVVQLFDYLGQKVHADIIANGSKSIITTETLLDGLYILRINIENESKAYRIIKY